MIHFLINVTNIIFILVDDDDKRLKDLANNLGFYDKDQRSKDLLVKAIFVVRLM